MFLPLLIGIFFKLGMTPLHLYKIEIYRGLPFITIFFYTTYFFLIWVVFFSHFFTFLLMSFNGF
jgi:NADH:ubiquinone oxidoreductase subunit 2 (subunit N)